MNNIIEVWSPIEGTDNMYHVSNTGKVYSSISDKVIAQHVGSHGYMGVIVCVNKKARKLLVHREVAKRFCENENGLRDVHHIDGNKSNNFAYNLAWLTHRENVLEHYQQKKAVGG